MKLQAVTYGNGFLSSLVLYMDNIKCIETKWWWGTSINFIEKDSFGIVELMLDNDFPNTAFIRGLIVPEESRRQGVAKRLLVECSLRASESGKRFLQLDVEKDETWLKEWYERLGFRVFCVEEHIYKMIKTL